MWKREILQTSRTPAEERYEARLELAADRGGGTGKQEVTPKTDSRPKSAGGKFLRWVNALQRVAGPMYGTMRGRSRRSSGHGSHCGSGDSTHSVASRFFDS
jgi:hypothetical protein